MRNISILALIAGLLAVMAFSISCNSAGGKGGGRQSGDDDQADDDAVDDDVSDDDVADDDAADDDVSDDDSADDDSSDDDTSDDDSADDDTTCNPPAAGFSGAPRAGSAPLAVAFTDESQTDTGCPITSWAWTFGDGGTSNSQDPGHTYDQGGTFTVSLTVTNSGGSDTETKNSYVAATCPVPVADFTGAPTSGNIPLTVQFTNASVIHCPNATYQWDFGDGGTSSEAGPSHAYTVHGTYTVTLIVTTDGGSNTKTRTDYIHANCSAPVADFSGSPVTGRKPLTVNFTDASTSNCPITSYAWTFGDGGTANTQSPSHAYQNTGTFTVALTVQSDGGQNTKTRANYVTVKNNPLVGLLSDADDARDVVVVGNYAYIANGESGLVVADVSDPANPVVTDTIGDRTYTGIDVAGSYAYVADPNIGDGIHIFNISNPSNIVWVGDYEHAGWSVGDVAVRGSYAYLPNDDEMEVINISNPASPTLAASLALNQIFADKIALSGNYAFLSMGSAGLVIADITDPLHPALAGTADTYDAKSVFILGQYGYVAEETGGMTVLDVFGIHPTQIGHIDNGWLTDVVLSGSYAYASDYNGALRIFNISNLTSPTQAGMVSTGANTYPEAVFKLGNYAYVPAESGGLVIVNVSNPASPSVAGTYKDANSDCRDVVVVGNYAFVANGEKGLQVINVSNPASPSLADSISDRTYTGIHVQGNYAYVADPNIGDGFHVFNISVPTNVTSVGSYYHDGWSTGDVFVSGNYAFLAEDDIMAVVNISNPASPTLTTTVDLGEIYADKINVVGNYAYLSMGSSGFVMVNVADPTHPVLAGSAVTYEANQVAAQGIYAFVADSNGLKIFDALGIHPEEIGSYSDSGSFTEDVFVTSPYAYLAEYGTGLKVLNVSTPASPSLLDTFSLSNSYPYGVFVTGNYVYLADSSKGLMIFNKYPTNW